MFEIHAKIHAEIHAEIRWPQNRTQKKDTKSSAFEMHAKIHAEIHAEIRSPQNRTQKKDTFAAASGIECVRACDLGFTTWDRLPFGNCVAESCEAAHEPVSVAAACGDFLILQTPRF